MGKKRVNKYPKAFRKMVLERLFKELGIRRTQLYKWRDQMKPVEDGQGPPANSRERELRKEIRELKRVLGEKVVELDFFKGALHKVEARRRSGDGSGEKASSTRSGS